MSEDKGVLADDPATRRESLERWAAEQERGTDPPPSRLRAGARAAREWARGIGYVRARWPRPLGTRPSISLAICAIFRNEAPYLAEWVSFHRLQGVERFYLYDNGSTDDWRSELEPELATGRIEVRDWPDPVGQAPAYQDCLQRHRNDARWIAFIDVDEFLFSPTGKPLPEILRRFDTHPNVVVNRHTYGTSGWKHPPEGLVTENYLWRAPDDFISNHWVKSIACPRKVVRYATPHNFWVRGDAVGEDGRRVQAHLRAPTFELLRINHYYTRSEEEFSSKVARPDASSGRIREHDPFPSDAVRDELILRFRPELRALLSSRADERTSQAADAAVPAGPPS
jgi:glycosyl transferase family 92